MKQKIYIFGLIVTLVILTGAIFKINHWPGANILLTAGMTVLVVLFVPVALVSNYKAHEPRQNLLLYIVSCLTCFVFFTAMLFKIMHWPFAGLLLTIAIPFPYVVFLPVFLAVTSGKKNFNIYNTVFVLFLLAISSVFTSLLALNVSRTTINDSYLLSGNYTRLENVLRQFPDSHGQPAINQKIDEVIKTINDYQVRILKQNGLTQQQWNENPENLLRPEAIGLASYAVMNPQDTYPGMELQTGIEKLMMEIRATPGYEDLAKAAPTIFDYFEPAKGQKPWAQQELSYNTLSWTLIYLDGLKANLSMIKLSGCQSN